MMRSCAQGKSFRWYASYQSVLLAGALLFSTHAAYAYFWEAVAPSSPTWTGSVGGCQPECSGSCGYSEFENGNVCAVTSCACCGCEEYSAQLNTWNIVGGTCFPDAGGGCACVGGDRIWAGTYTGTTARTTADCG